MCLYKGGILLSKIIDLIKYKEVFLWGWVMGEFWSAIKPTFPDPHMLRSRIYASTHLAVIETSWLTLGECACDQFHFLIPLRQAPVVKLEKHRYSLKERCVFPCNPRQPHRIEDTGIVDFQALVIYIDKTLLLEVAEELYGHRHLELTNECFEYSPALQELINSFIHEYQAQQPGSSLMLECLATQAAVVLLRESHNNLCHPTFQSEEYRNKKLITQAIEYIRDNYQNNISLNDLASQTHYSSYHFLRLFKQHTGKTPFAFLLDVKLEKAKTLLKHTDNSIEEICYLSGFSNPSHFSQIFKKKTGLSPSQYRLL